MTFNNTEQDSKSLKEKDLVHALYEHNQELLPHFGQNWNLFQNVTTTRQTLSRLIYYNELYLKIVNVMGVICEFGVQWGTTLSLLMNFRGMYEPYNISRKIYGFDTFSGFGAVSEEDGGYSKIGDYRTLPDYYETLDKILALHETNSPLQHAKKYELIKGDASVTIDKWLDDNPHAIIAMAIFDMDLYAPTKNVLEKIRPRLTKGSILVFDELNCKPFPGETAALAEVFGLNNVRLIRHPHQTYAAYMEFEG